MHPPLIDARVLAVRRLTPRINEYLLASASGEPLPRHEPGAHVELHLVSDTLGAFVRHYSLIGGDGLMPDRPDVYRIAVQRSDAQRGSACIHDSFAPGMALRMSWPKNHFLLGRNDTRPLLIAGGIGITPIYAMLRSLVRRKRDFSLVYSGRTAASMAYHEQVMALAGERGQLYQSGAGNGCRLDIAALLASQPDDTTVYVCGPASMVEATRRAGADLGWDESRIRSEHFGVAGNAADAAFTVHLARSGQSVAVGRDTSILDALSAAGVELLFDCRRGECGLCPLPVVDADGAIDHRDRYLSQDERDAGNTLCVCVSRVSGGTLTLDA